MKCHYTNKGFLKGKKPRKWNHFQALCFQNWCYKETTLFSQRLSKPQLTQNSSCGVVFFFQADPPLESLLTDFCQQLSRLIHLCPCTGKIKPHIKQQSKLLHSADTRTAHTTENSTAKRKSKGFAHYRSLFPRALSSCKALQKLSPSPQCF